jgi:hypothetical protein
VSVFGATWTKPAPEALNLLIVVVMAAIGASIHALTSLTTYVGNRRFLSSWTWWYIVRMPVGAAIALVLYFVLRAGFVSVTASSSDVNAYGIAAFAGLAGMFAKQATDKLREIFDVAFKSSSGDAERTGKVKETGAETPNAGAGTSTHPDSNGAAGLPEES